MTKRRRLSASVWVSFLAQNGPIIALILVVLWFSLQSKAFLTVGNSLIIGRAVAEMGIVALPMALLVIAGSIDLSVGSVLTVAAVLGAKVAIATGSVPLGFLAAVGFGVFAGVLNGILVCYMRLNPIVVTLGFLAVWAGVALMITNGRNCGRSAGRVWNGGDCEGLSGAVANMVTSDCGYSHLVAFE